MTYQQAHMWYQLSNSLRPKQVAKARAAMIRAFHQEQTQNNITNEFNMNERV